MLGKKPAEDVTLKYGYRFLGAESELEKIKEQF